MGLVVLEKAKLMKKHFKRNFDVYWILFACVLATLALPGCAQVDAVMEQVAFQGAQAADSKLRADEWSICNATTAGALRRNYKTQAEMDAWNNFCKLSQAKIEVAP